MHILITNDDGPPEQRASPYVHGLVNKLKEWYPNWHISVALPNVQRSWIGKSHFLSKPVNVTYYHSSGQIFDGKVEDTPSKDGQDYVLLDGTPATAAQIGIHHLFQEKGPVDLVISGPNFGRNSTALFALSSGTIGAAMESSLCGVKAIAVSFAHFSQTKDWEIIRKATELTVKLCLHLYDNWSVEADIYSINIPLIEGLPHLKILYTTMLRNKWGSCFTLADSNIPEANEKEESLRQEKNVEHSVTKPSQYVWSPPFRKVQDSVDNAPPGNDGWAISNHMVSVTPLKAAFHPVPMIHGEVKL